MLKTRAQVAIALFYCFVRIYANAFVSTNPSWLTENASFKNYRMSNGNRPRPQVLKMVQSKNVDLSHNNNDPLRVLRPVKTCRTNQMSGTDLAYIGDNVYEMFIRCRTVWPSKRTSDLQRQAVALVNAEYQSKLLARMKSDMELSEDEQQVLSRGRNSTSNRKNRKNPAAYQDSTALEALLGYLYIDNPGRCGEVLSWIDTVIDDL